MSKKLIYKNNSFNHFEFGESQVKTKETYVITI